MIASLLAIFSRLSPLRHFVEKGELMGEFRIDGGVWLVASGGHIEIVQGDRPRRARAPGAKRDGDMAGISFFAKGTPVDDLAKGFSRRSPPHDSLFDH